MKKKNTTLILFNIYWPVFPNSLGLVNHLGAMLAGLVLSPARLCLYFEKLPLRAYWTFVTLQAKDTVGRGFLRRERRKREAETEV